MRSGTEAAKALLIQVRQERISYPVVAGMLEAALPDNDPSRLGFLLVLSEYVTTALEGAATDPEYLGAGIPENSA